MSCHPDQGRRPGHATSVMIRALHIHKLHYHDTNKGRLTASGLHAECTKLFKPCNRNAKIVNIHQLVDPDYRLFTAVFRET